MASPDILIIGGGVIGLSIAYVLAREGVAATVLDRGEPGREASWAGAGLIAPHCERLTGSPPLELRSWSAVLYPEWSAALRDETGIDNGYRRCGGVDVAETPEEDQALRIAAGRWRTERIVFERLADADVRRVEPALNPALATVYFLPDRAQIRNPWHLRALQTAVTRRGAVVRPALSALGFDVQGDRVTAVRTEAGPLPCGVVVVAAGAWSGALLGSLGLRVPTPPLKGQIVLLKPNRPLLRRVVEHGKRYLVPRDEGRVLAGATEEDAGFDRRTTAQGVALLLDEAMRLCPDLARAEVEHAWAGLRPGSLDSRPYIGPAPGFANLVVATGHKRTGLQLSPATAEVVADLLLDRPPRVDLTPFQLAREPADTADEALWS